MRLFERFVSWLIVRVAMSRAPDFTIGENKLEPWLSRWWVIPRNRFFNVYLHRIAGDDDDRALHDHSSFNLSIILTAPGYIEIFADGRRRERRRGRLILRRGSTPHRLEVHRDEEQRPHVVWTLFLKGPDYREWGFHCPQGWRHWKDYTAPGDKESIGRGCD